MSEREAVVSLDYGAAYAMSLDDAMSMTRIIARSKKIEGHYISGSNMCFARIPELPKLSLRSNAHWFDATMLTDEQIREWVKSVSGSVVSGNKMDGTNTVSPEMFIKMKGA
jgi:hypothetical protein